MLDFYILMMVNTDEMQFPFVPGWCTADAIFIVCQMLRKYIDTNKPLHFALVELEKHFNCVPRKVLWLALRSIGLYGLCVIHDSYSNSQSHVRVNGLYSEEFGLGVGVHQRSIFSPLLFILVLEVLSCDLPTLQINVVFNNGPHISGTSQTFNMLKKFCKRLLSMGLSGHMGHTWGPARPSVAKYTAECEIRTHTLYMDLMISTVWNRKYPASHVF